MSTTESSCLATISATRERIAELRDERRQLESLMAEVRRGDAAFAQQMERRRLLARRALTPGGGGMGGALNARFARLADGVSRDARESFVGAEREIERAISAVNAEICRAQATVERTERTLAGLRAEGVVRPWR